MTDNSPQACGTGLATALPDDGGVTASPVSDRTLDKISQSIAMSNVSSNGFRLSLGLPVRSSAAKPTALLGIKVSRCLIFSIACSGMLLAIGIKNSLATSINLCNCDHSANASSSFESGGVGGLSVLVTCGKCGVTATGFSSEVGFVSTSTERRK
ncbi:hypothetical protein [Nostoc sp.]